MALLSERDVQANLRTRDGERVLYLAKGDHLSPSARDWLEHRRIPIISGAQSGMPDKPVFRTLFGAVLHEKPEHMTHLRADVLVFKDHPRIRFRGMIDALEAKILLAQKIVQKEGYPTLCDELSEVLGFVRNLIPCDVLEKPVGDFLLCGLNEQQLRQQSHHPEKFFGQPHFMPDVEDSFSLLMLNCVRTVVRQTELAAYDAFKDENSAVTRDDLILALNRLSSLLWIQMCKLKAGQYPHEIR